MAAKWFNSLDTNSNFPTCTFILSYTSIRYTRVQKVLSFDNFLLFFWQKQSNWLRNSWHLGFIFREIMWWACHDCLFRYYSFSTLFILFYFSGRYSIWNLFLMAPAITTFLSCSNYLQTCQSIWTYWDWRWFRFYILHQTAMGSLKHFRCSISKNRYLNHP